MYMCVSPEMFGEGQIAFSIPSHIQRRSVFAESELEIAKHKWIKSQLAGRDLGEEAVREWVQLHWSSFVRARWIEHLRGDCYWNELDSFDFDLVNRKASEKLCQIVEQLKQNAEQLNILSWAVDRDEDRDLILDLLDRLQINNKRLKHKYDPYFN